jgi:2-polyprenyl-3-methyl-5-hydroxy-6-metoxy-1,4-benzoquinol methylase
LLQVNNDFNPEEEFMDFNQGIDRYGWTSPDQTSAHSYLLPAIKKLLPGDGQLTILDAGCGNGYVAGKLSELGHTVIGVDLSEDGIVIARKTYPHIKFEVGSIYGDLQRLIKNVDVVVSSEVIEHLFSPKTFLANIYTVIRPGGCLILSTPYHGYAKNFLICLLNLWDKHHTVEWEGGHIKFFSEHSLSRMLHASGFGEITFGNAGRVPWLWKSMVCRAKKGE